MEKRKETLKELMHKEEEIRQELKVAKQGLRILESKQKELTRRKRVHRLCNHGGLLEKYLNPETFTDTQMDEILRTVFRWNDVIVLINDIAKRNKTD